jgi:co-chaperonin GroES (HSP10)
MEMKKKKPNKAKEVALKLLKIRELGDYFYLYMLNGRIVLAKEYARSEIDYERQKYALRLANALRKAGVK